MNSNAINSIGAASTVTSCCARLHRFISGIARRVASVQWRSVFRRCFPPPVFFSANVQNTPYEPHLASAAAGLMHARARMPRKMRWTMQSAQQTNARRIYFPAAPASHQPASARPDAWRALHAHAMPSPHELELRTNAAQSHAQSLQRCSCLCMPLCRCKAVESHSLRFVLRNTLAVR